MIKGADDQEGQTCPSNKQQDLNRSLKLSKALSDGSLEKELFKIKDNLETVVLNELEIT